MVKILKPPNSLRYLNHYCYLLVLSISYIYSFRVVPAKAAAPCSLWPPAGAANPPPTSPTALTAACPKDPRMGMTNSFVLYIYKPILKYTKRCNYKERRCGGSVTPRCAIDTEREELTILIAGRLQEVVEEQLQDIPCKPHFLFSTMHKY